MKRGRIFTFKGGIRSIAKLCFLILLVVFSTSTYSQKKDDEWKTPVRLKGKTKLDGKKLKSVELYVFDSKGNKIISETLKRGKFKFNLEPDREHVLIFRKEGYKMHVINFSTVFAGVDEVDIPGKHKMFVHFESFDSAKAKKDSSRINFDLSQIEFDRFSLDFQKTSLESLKDYERLYKDKKRDFTEIAQNVSDVYSLLADVDLGYVATLLEECEESPQGGAMDEDKKVNKPLEETIENQRKHRDLLQFKRKLIEMNSASTNAKIEEEKGEEMQKQLKMSVRVNDKFIGRIDEAIAAIDSNIKKNENTLSEIAEKKRRDSLMLAGREDLLEDFEDTEIVNDTSTTDSGYQVITTVVTPKNSAGDESVPPEADEAGIGSKPATNDKQMPFAKEIEIDGKIVFLLHLAYESGSSEVSDAARHLLQEKFKSLYKDKKGAKPILKIEIFGHADLERASSTADFEYEGYCESVQVAPNQNECLGRVRALRVKKELDNFLTKNVQHVQEGLVKKVDEVIYDPHFLLGGVDKLLGYQLIKGLGYQENVDKCLKWLNINAPSSKEQAMTYRGRDDIQLRIRSNPDQFRDLFEPFRCVVVIIHYD